MNSLEWILPLSALGLLGLAVLSMFTLPALRRSCRILPSAAPSETQETDSATTPTQSNAVVEGHPLAAGESDSPRENIRGNLAQFPARDLLQYLALSGKSGLLEIQSGRRQGYILFESGRMSAVSFRGRHGLNGLFPLLELPEGDYRFDVGQSEWPEHVERGGKTPFIEVMDALLQYENHRKKTARSAA